MREKLHGRRPSGRRGADQNSARASTSNSGLQLRLAIRSLLIGPNRTHPTADVAGDREAREIETAARLIWLKDRNDDTPRVAPELKGRLAVVLKNAREDLKQASEMVADPGVGVTQIEGQIVPPRNRNLCLAPSQIRLLGALTTSSGDFGAPPTRHRSLPGLGQDRPTEEGPVRPHREPDRCVG